MSFDYEGYLSEQIEKIESEIYNKNKKFFLLFEEYNKFAHQLKFKLKIHSQNAQEITVSGLFILMLNSFNSIYILTKKGLINDSKSLTRAFVEKLINLKYCSQKHENTIQYIYQDEFRRLKFLNIIKYNKIKSFDAELIDTIDFGEIDRIKGNINKYNIKELPTVEELANIVGYPDLYSFVYRLFSDEIHANSKVIEKFFELNQDQEIGTLKWYPDLKNIDREVRLILMTCIDMLDKALNIIFKLYDIEDGFDESSNEYKVIKTTLEELSTKESLL